MLYANVGTHPGNCRHKAKEATSARENFMETLRPWVCCSRPRHNSKGYFDLEKSAGSSAAYSISNPVAVEVNGKAGDTGKPHITSAQELPASPVPKRLDESFDPKLPTLSMNLYDSNHERRETFDFFNYQPPSQNRITQTIGSYGEHESGGNCKTKGTPPVPTRSSTVTLKTDDDRLRSEVEFIRAASRKYPENSDLSAASDATYLVDEKGEPRPEMIEIIDRVLGGSAKERKYLSGSTETSYYSNTSNLIQPLQPKPARCRDSDQPRQLLRSMDERKQLEQRLLNIQRALTQRKNDMQRGDKDSLMAPPQVHGTNGVHHPSQHITGELIDELIDDFYDADCPQVTQDTVSKLPDLPAPSAQLPHRAPTLTAINQRKTTFRHSNPLHNCRFSLNYSEYIYEEYGKPSPSEAVFSGEEDPYLMRSVSQRPVESPPPLRRTRSSETIVPPKTLMLSRDDSTISMPGNRLNRWLSKQGEYFGGDRPGPISSLPRLPQDPRTSQNSVRLQSLRRSSIGTPGDFWPSARDIAGSPDARFLDNETSSCVGIPYSAMLKKGPATSVVSVNSSSTYHSAPSVLPHQQCVISKLDAIPGGTGKQHVMEAPTDSAAVPPSRPTGFEAGRMV